MSDDIDEIVDWQMSKRPGSASMRAHACGTCQAVWHGDPICPYCGKAQA